MKIKNIHKWDLSVKEAIELQKTLSAQLIMTGDITNINYICGCDISFNKNSNIGYASIVLLTYPELKTIEKVSYVGKAIIPYIPGLLSFRESPLIIEGLKKLSKIPDIIICDGQGYAHPRRLGLASHLGLLTDLPTIGCAKSLFIGTFESKSLIKGNYSLLYDKDEVIGYVLYTKDRCNPLFISVGHKVSLEFSKKFILSCIKKSKHPEPSRQAHLHSNEIRKFYMKEAKNEK